MEFFKFEMAEDLRSATNIFKCGDTTKMKFKKNGGKCGEVTVKTKETANVNLRL